MVENGEKIHDARMGDALQLARLAADNDEVPVGAIVVKDGQIIGKGYNRKEGLNMATRHAEIEAIEEASKALGAWRLIDCELYVTLEPCPMCAGAILQSRIKHLYYGTEDPKGGAVCSLYHLLEDARWNHQTTVTGPIRKEECAQLLSDFFKQKRQSR